MYLFFFFKQKTAYEMRISDWSSDVCSSDLQNALGDAAIQSLRGHGVDCRRVIHREGRMGLYFVTPGAGLRPTDVVYDRTGSAFAETPAEAWDRSEERRVGKGCVSTCSYRWDPYH